MLGAFAPDGLRFVGYYAKRYARSLRSMRGGRGGRGKTAVVFLFKTVNVRLFRPELHKILNTPKGELWKRLHARGRLITRDAKRQVGVKTGALRSSINMRHRSSATGQYLRIGSNVDYAYYHHEGTKRHLIHAKTGPNLVFMSGSRIIRTPVVNHPGSRPNRYLRTPMNRHVRRPIIIK
jgi:hypothetical protein